MGLIKWLSGESKKQELSHDTLIPLLAGMVRPFRQPAIMEQIESALQEFSDDDVKGRFLKFLWQVCLASILSRVEEIKDLPSDLSQSFKAFALSQWSRSPGISLESEHKMFDFTRQQLGTKLKNPPDEALIELGLLMLSLAIQEQEEFEIAIAYEWGRTAHSCWSLARLETDKALNIHDYVTPSS